ncbi:hypothetical protein BCR32DRAFT_269786 [Anaeromyces robustus]|uniref:WD40 repeat-like protein n=1 Tax=Anaeromyces robustus TaxID=1754192 RepID=A0A1Y1WZW6_9FUNG|nr:hypothetical protein BCR32DRAFT_269786 [Anaeromyces robustus]|eukprot:ORX78925.1 hypothetical protein BCR32DRAFT_269786 [Anaeromyces robustus]
MSEELKKNNKNKKKHEISNKTLSNYNKVAGSLMKLDEKEKDAFGNDLELPRTKKQRLSLVFDIGERSPFKFNEKVLGNEQFKYISPTITPDNNKSVIKKKVNFSTYSLISPLEEEQLNQKKDINNSPKGKKKIKIIKNKKSDIHSKKTNKNKYELHFKTEAKHSNTIFINENFKKSENNKINYNDNNNKSDINIKNDIEVLEPKNNEFINNNLAINNVIITDGNDFEKKYESIDNVGNEKENSINNKKQTINEGINIGNDIIMVNDIESNKPKVDNNIENLNVWSETEPFSADLFKDIEDEDILISSKLSDNNENDNIKLINDYNNNDIIESSLDFHENENNKSIFSDISPKLRLKENIRNIKLSIESVIDLGESENDELSNFSYINNLNFDNYDNQMLMDDTQNDDLCFSNGHLNKIDNKDEVESLSTSIIECENVNNENEELIYIHSYQVENKNKIEIEKENINKSNNFSNDESKIKSKEDKISENKFNEIMNNCKIKNGLNNKSENGKNNNNKKYSEKHLINIIENPDNENDKLLKEKEIFSKNINEINDKENLKNIPLLDLNKNHHSIHQVEKMPEEQQGEKSDIKKRENSINIIRNKNNKSKLIDIKSNRSETNLYEQKCCFTPKSFVKNPLNNINEDYILNINRLKSNLIPSKNLEPIIESNCNCLHLNKIINKVVVGKYATDNNKNWLIMETKDSIEVWQYDINFDSLNKENYCYWTKCSERLKNFCEEIYEIKLSPTNEYFVVIGSNYSEKSKKNYYRCGLIIDMYTLNEIYLDIKINNSINTINTSTNKNVFENDYSFSKICFPLSEYTFKKDNLNYEKISNKLFIPGYKDGQLIEFTIKNLSKIESCTYPIPKNSSSPLLSIISYDNDNPSIIGLMENMIAIWNIKTKEILSEISLSNITLLKNIKLISTVIPPVKYLLYLNNKDKINYNNSSTSNININKQISINKYFSLIFYSSFNNDSLKDIIKENNRPNQNNYVEQQNNNKFGIYIFFNNQLKDKIFYETIISKNDLKNDEITCYEDSEEYIFIGYKSGKIILWEKNSQEIGAILNNTNDLNCVMEKSKVFSLSFHYNHPRTFSKSYHTPGLLFANFENKRVLVFYIY